MQLDNIYPIQATCFGIEDKNTIVVKPIDGTCVLRLKCDTNITEIPHMLTASLHNPIYISVIIGQWNIQSNTFDHSDVVCDTKQTPQNKNHQETTGEQKCITRRRLLT
jgi:hypothetical protein